jgi:hypothetical protein
MFFVVAGDRNVYLFAREAVDIPGRFITLHIWNAPLA